MANFFNQVNNIMTPRDTMIVRQERIKREGSPYYTWQVPATAAAATANIYVPDQFPASKKYEPLDWLEIVNNEASNDITLKVGNDSFSVPAGSIRTITNKSLRDISVANNGGAITTLNKITVTMRKQPLTVDKWAQRQK